MTTTKTPQNQEQQQNSKPWKRRRICFSEFLHYWNEMSSFQHRTTRHTKKQEGMAQSDEKSKSTETVPRKHLMPDPPDKDFKITVLDMLRS